MTDDIRTDPTSSRPFVEDDVGYDPTTGTFHARFDANSNCSTVVVSIVETVATVTNADPTTLSPLYATVDPDALADIVASNGATPVDVTFSYEDCRVTVSSHGTVVVEPPRE